MNTFRLYKIFLLFCIALMLHSCKKLIEVDPPVGIIGTGEVFNTNEQANSAMAGVFSQMMSNAGAMAFSNGGLTIYAGLSAGELVNLAGTENLMDYQFYTNKLDFTNSTPSSIIWQPAYKLIYGANAVIEGITASTSTLLNDSTRKVLTGEALFVRAFCYFYLTNMFGDVPLALTTDFNKTLSMKKTPQAEVYNQIVKDLQEAQIKLPADYSTAAGERVRPNKWAATALLARTQLYLENWEDAEIQASVVIGNSLYGLPANLNDVFLKTSREAIWQMKQNPAAKPVNATWEGFNLRPWLKWSDFSADEQMVFLLFPDFYSELAAAIIPTYYLAPQVVQVFETDDKRRSQWIDSTPAPADAPYNGAPYHYALKYTLYDGLATDPIPQYYMMLRLAEQHLIRAEARAQLNDLAGAAADIDTLRGRAGLQHTTAATKEALLTAVMLERQRELFAEWGHRWLDLKRTNQATTVLGSLPYKQPWKASQLLYPIPPDEISANPNLIQNPDY